MASFNYKETKTVTMKVAGLLNLEEGLITVEEVEKPILHLLKDFDDQFVEIVIKTKDEVELDDPTLEEE